MVNKWWQNWTCRWTFPLNSHTLKPNEMSLDDCGSWWTEEWPKISVLYDCLRKSYDVVDCSVTIYFVTSNFLSYVFNNSIHLPLSDALRNKCTGGMTMNVLSNACRLCVNAKWIIYINNRAHTNSLHMTTHRLTERKKIIRCINL